MSEYLFLVAMIITALTIMTTLIKRALQGRIRDARWTMQKSVRQYYNGTIWMEYEPYYANSTTDTYATTDQHRQLLPGLSSGISRKRINDQTMVETNRVQNPAKDAD